MNNVDSRLLDRFRIAQRLNRGGQKELRALEELWARVDESHVVMLGAPRAQMAVVIPFPPRD